MISEPVVGKNFFGREETLGLLDRRMKAMRDGYRQNIAITGQSLAGKSSLLQHFLYTAVDDSFLPVYIEVLKEDFQSFANKFMATLLYNSMKSREDLRPDDFNGLIAKAEKALPKTVSAVREVLAQIEKRELDGAYTKLLGLTSVVKEETAKSCIVILDEFDNISGFRVKNPFSSFGKVIMTQKDTMYIISSSRNSALKKILREKLSLLFGNFEIVDLKGFSSRAASEFLDRKAHPFVINGGLKKFLIYFTDGNPFYLEHLALEAKNIARDRQLEAIDPESMQEAIVNLVYGANGTIHQYLSNLLFDLLDTRSRESGISILASAASGHRRQREMAKDLRMSSSDVSKSLNRLMDLGLVARSGVFWEISDRMLEFWLSHVHLSRQRMLVNYIVDRARTNRDDIREYMNGFLLESGKTVLERVFELFNLFSGEIVDIDDKRFSLPQFDKVEIKAFDDITPCICASLGGKAWLCRIFDRPIGESDIAEFLRNARSLDSKVERKILIALGDIEDNARLLAKELRMSIWNLDTANLLLRLYGRRGLVLL